MLARMSSGLQQLTARFFGDATINRAMQASATASAWVIGTTVAGTFLRLVSNLIMTRLVAPEAFGVLGIAFSVVYAVEMLSDIGLSDSIVRSRRGEEPVYLRTAWIMTIVRSTSLALIVCAIAFGIAANRGSFPEDSVYALPVTPWIIAAISIQIFLMGLASPNLFLARRRLKQGRLSVIEIGGRLVDIPIMVVLGLAGFGVWALVIGTLVNALLRTVLSHVYLEGPRMRFEFEREAFWELFHYGKWLLIASAANIAIHRGDQFLFGAQFDSRAFSLYVTAGIWIGAFRQLLTKLLMTVCFSAIAETLREAPEKLAGVYRRFRAMADMVCITAFVGLVLFHELLFTIIYPPDFEPAKEFVPFMAMAFLFLPFDLLGRVGLSAGDSRGYSLVQAVNAFAVILVLPLVFELFGMMAAVMAFGCMGALTAPMLLRIGAKHMQLDFLTEARMFVFALFAGTFVVLVFL